MSIMVSETDLIFLALNLTSVFITSILTVFLVRFYRYFHYIPLENIVLGFGILVVSYSFGAAYQILRIFPVVPKTNLLLLINLALQTLAFSFITVGYIFWKQEKKASRLMILLTSLVFFVVILAVLSALVYTSDAIPDFAAWMEYFHGVNFALLAFVAVKSFRNYVARPDVRSSTVPGAFTLLAVSQYSLFIWSIDRGTTSLTLGAICRVIGFVLFLRVVFVQRRAAING